MYGITGQRWNLWAHMIDHNRIISIRTHTHAMLHEQYTHGRTSSNKQQNMQWHMDNVIGRSKQYRILTVILYIILFFFFFCFCILSRTVEVRSPGLHSCNIVFLYVELKHKMLFAVKVCLSRFVTMAFFPWFGGTTLKLLVDLPPLWHSQREYLPS